MIGFIKCSKLLRIVIVIVECFTLRFILICGTCNYVKKWFCERFAVVVVMQFSNITLLLISYLKRLNIQYLVVF